MATTKTGKDLPQPPPGPAEEEARRLRWVRMEAVEGLWSAEYAVRKLEDETRYQRDDITGDVADDLSDLHRDLRRAIGNLRNALMGSGILDREWWGIDDIDAALVQGHDEVENEVGMARLTQRRIDWGLPPTPTPRVPDPWSLYSDAKRWAESS